MHPRFHERAQLECLAEIVHEEHCLRLDVKVEEPLVPRRFKHRPRPKTAIIARAAQEAIAAREWAEETTEKVA